MKQSKLFTKTRKEFAKDETAINARLLIKAGFIDKLMAGVYTFLPLGLRVLNKIENIIREEMNSVDGQEIMMPALNPKENWVRTGRWDSLDILFKLDGTSGKEYALAATHEEVVTPLAQQFICSYKDLPLSIYQFQTKFRNEPRAKSGLLRGREFRMKDMYSFHTNEADMEEYYEKVAEAYERIWDRIGIGDKTMRVFASGGSFSKYSDEYQTICETGEDLIFHVPSKKITFNREIAPARAPELKNLDSKELPMKEVEGVGIIGVTELAKFLKIPVEKTTKTIIFETDKGEVIAAAVRGDYDINEEKLRNVIGCQNLELANEETVKRVTGAEVGYAGILNLPTEVKVYLDDSVAGRKNFECGANKTNFHTINVNFGRDLPEPKEYYDFKVAKEGDFFPETGEKYITFRASEVGNIFKLKTKYSAAFNVKYSDEKGTLQPVIMGCYGIGPSRVMGTIVEIFNDENGIIWPESVAPFKYHLINLSQSDKVKSQADELYTTLTERGEEVLYDDRTDASPGEKLKDADLIGIPIRLIISDKTKGKIEVKKRNSKDVKMQELEELLK